MSPERPTTADRFRAFREKLQGTETELQISKDAHWRGSEGAPFYCLHAGEKVLAVAFPKNNTATYRRSSRPDAQFRMTAPDSVSIFEAVEARLALARVTDLRDDNGQPAPADWRKQFEDKAHQFQGVHPKETEPRYYVGRALSFIFQDLEHADDHGRDAYTLLGSIADSVDANNGKWTRADRRSLDNAHKALANSVHSDIDADAQLDCERAMAALDRVKSVAKETGVSHLREDGIKVHRDHADYGVKDPGWERTR